MKNKKIVIIGAGISGLIAANELERKGIEPIILESKETIGGRVQTDHKNGFILDRGFQVLPSAYPEVARYIDVDTLDLKPFHSGAVIHFRGKKHIFSDPVKHPGYLYSTLCLSIASPADLYSLWKMQRKIRKWTLEEIFKIEDQTTLSFLKSSGISPGLIHSFFTPFFGGIFLENKLETSARMFAFTFKMFLEGKATIPANGMMGIPLHLAEKLKKTKIIYNQKVRTIQGNYIIMENGQTMQADKIIVTSSPDKLIQGLGDQMEDFREVYQYYFAADFSTIGFPAIALVPEPEYIINNYTYMTDISPEYSSDGRALLSVTVLNRSDMSLHGAGNKAKEELSMLTGHAKERLELIKSYYIKKALPVIRDMQYSITPSECRILDHVYLAGDYMLNPSLNAAMTSGRLAAEALVSDLEAGK